jgi:methyl-accepting chemotaxis protein
MTVGKKTTKSVNRIFFMENTKLKGKTKLQLIISLTACAIIPILLLGGALSWLSQDEFNEIQQSKVILAQQQFDSIIKDKLEMVDLINSNLSRDDLLQKALKDKDISKIRNIVNTNFNDVKSKGISLMEVGDEKGTVIYRGHDPTKFGDDKSGNKMIQNAIKKQPSTDLAAENSAVTIRSVYPVIFEGEFVGTLTTGISLQDAFADVVKSLTGTEVNIFVDGLLKATTLEKDGKRIADLQIDEEIKSNLATNESYIGDNKFEDQLFSVVYFPVLDQQKQAVGIAGLFIPQDQIEQSKNDMLLMIGFFIITFTVLSIVAALWISKIISKPIQIVMDGMRQMVKGDLTTRIHSKYYGEMGELIENFNKLSQQLNESISNVAISSRKVYDSASLLSQSMEEATRTEEQVVQRIQDVAGNSEGQNQEISNSVQQISVISKNVQNIAIRSNELTSRAHDVEKETEQGSIEIQSANGQMEQMRESVESASKIMNELTSSSEKIGQIVAVISNIAGQTNLLALNAAIEAARAGEHGKGFAVVSTEVRKLAEQSLQAAKQISGIIGGMVEKVSDANESMKNGAEEVNKGVKLFKNINERFTTIKVKIDDVVDTIESIQRDTNETSGSIAAIVIMTKKVESLSSAMVSSSQEVAAATEEQMATIEEVAASADSLSLVASQLDEVVKQFKFKQE